MNLEIIHKNLTEALESIPDAKAKEKINACIFLIDTELSFRQKTLETMKPFGAAGWLNFYLATRLTSEEVSKTRCV